MSKESAKKFMEKIKSDSGFAQRCEKCEDGDQAVAFGKEEGYDFSKEELESASKEMKDEEGENIAVRMMNRCLLKGSC